VAHCLENRLPVNEQTTTPVTLSWEKWTYLQCGCVAWRHPMLLTQIPQHPEEIILLEAHLNRFSSLS